MTIDVVDLPGPLCKLRALRASDAASLSRHADDEQVWRNLFEGFPRPYTLADAERWCSEGCRQSESGLVWGIEVGGDAGANAGANAGADAGAEIIGCIGVRPDSGWLRCNGEVGYWIGRAFWRRGIASEALRRVTDWVWSNLPELTRLYAPIFAWNEGSKAVARKCGYIVEGELRRSAIKDGRVIDRTLYAMVRPESA